MRMVGLLLLIAFGVFLFVFGGYDDSPGAQGLGLLIVMTSGWRLFAGWRSERLTR